MIDAGQAATFPKLDFIAARMTIEKLIEKGRMMDKPSKLGRSIDGTIGTSMSRGDIEISQESASISPEDIDIVN